MRIMLRFSFTHSLLFLYLFTLSLGCTTDPSHGGNDDDAGIDTSSDTNTDTDTATGWCDGLLDQATSLCWENPPNPIERNLSSAQTYCESLGEGWRLPLIQELISLIRECGSADCPVSDPDCLEDECNDGLECEPCTEGQGPSSNGCYWSEDLQGTCPEGYWHWSVSDAYLEDFVWQVNFRRASIFSSSNTAYGFYICVSEAP